MNQTEIFDGKTVTFPHGKGTKTGIVNGKVEDGFVPVYVSDEDRIDYVPVDNLT